MLPAAYDDLCVWHQRSWKEGKNIGKPNEKALPV
jgi:hypothetical protein